MRTVKEIDWRGKIAVVRADFNVPMANGQITDDSRLRAALQTLRHILQGGGGAVCLSHLGRPKAGTFTNELSLSPVAIRLSELLAMPVAFQSAMPTTKPAPGEVWVLENTRFNIGEKENSPNLAAVYAALGDVFVMDAFATAHRKESSTCQLAYMADDTCAGLLLQQETAALTLAMQNPARPMTVIVGGGKVSTKLALLERMMPLCDRLIIGGGIANTLFSGIGAPIGASLAEPAMGATMCELRENYRDKLTFPGDLIIGTEISPNAKTRMIPMEQLLQLGAEERILDIGEESRRRYANIIRHSRTIVWSGPMGVFEYAPFAAGTRAVAEAIAQSSAYSLAGGGDTLAAIARFNVGAQISYLSTGGGAFLAFLGGATLPALHALEEIAKAAK